MRPRWTALVVGSVGLTVVLSVVLSACGGDDSATPRSSSTTGTSTTEVAPVVPATAPSTAPSSTAPPPSAPTTAAPTADAGHVFPVRAAAGGSATYARSHHDYPAADIFAPCGSTVVAVTDGVVQGLSRTDSWDSRVNSGDTRGGLFVSVVGDDGVRYYGSHLREVDAALSPGARVRRDQRLGAVGDTGDAKGVGCHLHFGLSAPCGPGDWQRRRGEVWPQKYLDAWRTGATASPAPEITTRRC